MKHLKLTILCFIFCLSLAGTLAASEWAQGQLLERSTEYLRALDKGQYETAWQSMNQLFKTLNDRSRWVTRQIALRDAYGPLTSRNLRRLTHRKTYSNSPDGYYVIIQFESVFANKANAIETVILHCPSSQECMVREYIIN